MDALWFNELPSASLALSDPGAKQERDDLRTFWTQRIYEALDGSRPRGFVFQGREACEFCSSKEYMWPSYAEFLSEEDSCCVRRCREVENDREIPLVDVGVFARVSRFLNPPVRREGSWIHRTVGLVKNYLQDFITEYSMFGSPLKSRNVPQVSFDDDEEFVCIPALEVHVMKFIEYLYCRLYKEEEVKNKGKNSSPSREPPSGWSVYIISADFEQHLNSFVQELRGDPNVNRDLIFHYLQNSGSFYSSEKLIEVCSPLCPFGFQIAALSSDASVVRLLLPTEEDFDRQQDVQLAEAKAVIRSGSVVHPLEASLIRIKAADEVLEDRVAKLAEKRKLCAEILGDHSKSEVCRNDAKKRYVYYNQKIDQLNAKRITLENLRASNENAMVDNEMFKLMSSISPTQFTANISLEKIDEIREIFDDSNFASSVLSESLLDLEEPDESELPSMNMLTPSRSANQPLVVVEQQPSTSRANVSSSSTQQRILISG